MHLKKEISKYLILILLLCPMLGVCQKVSIDSINKTTHYDRLATIAAGNISKQRDSLINVNTDQQRLIDSLRKESTNYKTEADTLRKALNNLKFAIREKDIQLDSKDKDLIYSEKLFEADLNALRRKRLGLGLSAGYGLNENGTGAYAGLGITYTFIRF